MVFIDYLEKGRTIIVQYYALLLDQLISAIQTKHPDLVKKKDLFHLDNTPAHTSQVVAAKHHYLHFEVLPYAPYSPDLVPSDYVLFPNLKK